MPVIAPMASTVSACRYMATGMAMAAHEVSLASAAAVAVALEHAGYHVVRLTIAADGTWHDGRVRLPGLADAVRTLSGRNVVIPVVHGPRGEDGTLAALCDLGGITCVGSGLRAGALGMDKQVTKLIAADSGIATAPAVLSPLPRPPATAGPAPS